MGVRMGMGMEMEMGWVEWDECMLLYGVLEMD